MSRASSARPLTVARVTPAAAAQPEEVLKFDFEPEVAAVDAPKREKPQTVKEAIIRWLEERL